MSETSVVHASFSVEKSYDIEPERVFAAWADQGRKAAWFAPAPAAHSLDFRVGGEEHVSNALPTGGTITFDSLYRDIVPGRRIVYTSELAADGRLSTVSVTTVEFEEVGDGSRLILTEQDVYLDGQEKPEWREAGTRDWLERLSGELEGVAR
jgi:uncharacterized protein YndB with AHSA1/START domain